MVKNYEEWKRAVDAEYKKLQAVDMYLNEDGQERYKVFRLLDSMACFYDTAAELLDRINNKDSFYNFELADIESSHAKLPIAALRKIAEHETRAN